MDLSKIEQLVKIKESSKIIDLTHTMEEGMPAWPTQARYSSTVYESYDYGNAAIHSRITMSEHSGTHMDAPRHFFKTGKSIDELSPVAIFGRGVRILADNIDPKGLFSKNDLIEFEAKNGKIREGDIVMFYFGWGAKWAIQPNAGSYLKDYPGLSEEVALILKERKISAVGCDTLSIDAFGSKDECHYVFLGNGIPIIENLANLPEIPVFSFVMGLPNKFKSGSGSPLRIFAMV